MYRIRKIKKMKKSEKPSFSPEEAESQSFDISAHFDALAERTSLEALHDPEVQEAVGILASEFGIKPEFYEGDHGSARSMLLFSLGAKLVEAERLGQNSITHPEVYEFLADATLLIAQDFVDEHYKDVVKDMQQEANGPYSDKHKAEVIGKYRSQELTDALNERIKTDDLLGPVREGLGITAETEKPFELVVLTKGQDDTMVYGFDTGLDYPDWDDKDLEFEQKVEKSDKVARESDIKRSWEEGLLRRGYKFSQEYDGSSQNQIAFVTSLEGTTYLCMSADTAERIAYSQDRDHRAGYYEDEDLDRDIAFLRHEYAHTQSDLRMENLIGINLEERRAEYFSGDKHGYHDIKWLFQDIRLATGFDITETMAGLTNGGTAEQVYSSVSQAVGIDKLIDVTLAVPRPYYEAQSNAIVKNSYDYVGGYDGVVDSIYDSLNENQRKEANERIDEFLDRVTESIGEEGLKDVVLGYRTTFSKSGTAKIKERAVERGIVLEDIKEAA
jgi:hypothetical protein